MAARTTRLTKRTLDALTPRDAAYEVADATLTGFYVRVYPSGSKSAVIRYVAGRRQRRFSLGRLGPDYTISMARSDAKTRLAGVRMGEDPSLDRRQRRRAATFGEVAERYFSEHAEPRLKPSTTTSYRQLLDTHILPVIGRMPLDDIERTDVHQLHHRVGKTAKGAANRALAVVSAIFSVAEAWGYRDGRTNPCRGVKRFKEHPRERFLSAEERARLEQALRASEAARKGHRDYVSPGALAAIRLLTLTGARRGEITGLTWAMVDLDRGCLRLPDSKTGAKQILLSRQAVDLLRALRDKRASLARWVCVGEDGGPVHNLYRAWKSVCRRANLDDVRLHDLRHSLASDMLASGEASLAVVGRILGHKTAATTQRYAHLHDDIGRRALQCAADRIERHAQGPGEVVSLDDHRSAGER